MKLRTLLPACALLAGGCAVDVVPPVAADGGAAVVTELPAPDGPDASDAPTTDAELTAVLDAVAAAFLAGDPEALRPYLDDPASVFGTRWLQRAEDMADVPFASYTLSLETSLPDLATARVRSRHGDETQVRYVLEEHALEGFDASGPAAEDLFLTFVATDDGWRIASDRDAEPLGLISVDHLWDHGPVVTTGAGDVVALHHPGTAGLDEVVAEAGAALDQVRERWPLAWPEKVPVLVPADQDELAQLLHVTFDLSNFIAFATATPTGELGAYDLTGSRILLNTERFLSRSSETRQRILVHELTHVATRPWAGPFVPSWLDEGIAQAMGEQRATTGLGQLQELVSSGATIDLPTDGQFTTGGRDRIFLSYQLGFSFVDHLVRTYGADRVAAFYADLGARAGRPGTETWHIDGAAQATFGVPLDELVAAWRASL